MLFGEIRASCGLAKTKTISSTHAPYFKFEVFYPIHNIQTHLCGKF